MSRVSEFSLIFLSVVGAPEEPIPSVSLWPLLLSNIHMTGSAIGSPQDIREMFEVAVKHNVRPWIQKVSYHEPRFQLLTPLLSKIPLRDANDAVVKMEEGKARYRFVLVNETNGGKVTDEE